MENLSSNTASVWQYTSQYRNFVQSNGIFQKSTVAIIGNLYTAVLTGINAQPNLTEEGSVTYNNGKIIFTNTAFVPFYLYLVHSSEIPAISLTDGYYPVWNQDDTIGIGDPDYPRYIWTLYQT